MKLVVSLFIVLFFYSFQNFGQKIKQGVKLQFVLQGKISNQYNGYVYLKYTDFEKENIVDSCDASNGKFLFSGMINEPTAATLYVKVKSHNIGDPNSILFFLEPSVIKISLELNQFSSANIIGSKTQNEYSRLQKSERGFKKSISQLDSIYNIKYDDYRKKMKNATEEELKPELDKLYGIRDQIGLYRNNIFHLDLNYINQYPDSYLSLYLIYIHSSLMKFDSLNYFYSRLKPSYKKNRYGTSILDQINQRKIGSSGAQATNFRGIDIAGDTLSLSKYIGKKYVLLDFWASWCLPCRKQTPILLKIYNQYGSDLEIIGIADDDETTDAWKKAIDKDQTGIWVHVLRGLIFENGNLKSDDNDINKKYNVQSIPTEILIDKNGVIIGRYSSDAEDIEVLEGKLKQIISRK